MTTHSGVHHRHRVGMVAATLLGAVTMLAACRSGYGVQDSGPAEAATQEPVRPLALGQPSPEEQEISRYGRTGKFTITPEKVVEGTQQDLHVGDDNTYARQKIFWVYVNAKQVDGQPVTGPMVMGNIGAETTTGDQATQLILLNDLSSRPKDCSSENPEARWEQGVSRTWCAPYLSPAGAEVTKVTYFQGYYTEPLAWMVP